MVVYDCSLFNIRYQATCFEYSYWYILWTHGKNIMIKMCVIYVVECMTGSYVARIIRKKIDIWKNWYFICSLTLIQSLQCSWCNRAPIAAVTGERRRWKSWASLSTTGLATQGRAALVHVDLFANQIIWVGDCSAHIPFSGCMNATIHWRQQICASWWSQGIEDSHKSSLLTLQFCQREASP